ncbi:hypothetical protein PSMK_05970 [Phycisphaera mikurensis NBRC 102666]|uniref:Uncharacterized protein n=1 Tax=Phycisphaera mikurensis (strain NBRC 102666 / KCTC 22515 / FYK2301M01) TaxID=1142394 RepID=I0IBW8_PHYMF|nr:hypothetical protein PSMK_05970 [Phycisphaera mikurensis NBRC 102666]
MAAHRAWLGRGPLRGWARGRGYARRAAGGGRGRGPRGRATGGRGGPRPGGGRCGMVL